MVYKRHNIHDKNPLPQVVGIPVGPLILLLYFDVCHSQNALDHEHYWLNVHAT